MRNLAVVPVLTFALLTALPATLPAQTFSEQTSTVVVEVPVQVLRDNQPVRGLTAGDFEVFDGRKQQPVVGFEVVDVSEGAPPQKVSAAGRRHFLILFDLAFSQPRAVVRGRQAAADVVAGLHPTDLVGVATYTATKGPQLVLGFTSDRGQIAAALDSLGNPQMLDRNADPLRLVLASERAANASRQALGTGAARGAGAGAEEAEVILEHLTRETEAASAAAQRSAVLGLTRSLSDLAKVMGGVNGRKYVVYLSEGFDPSLIMGTTDEERRDELAAASQSGEIWRSDSTELYGDTRTLNDVEEMLEELRRADCVVQAVDIAGLRPAGDMGGQRLSGKETLLNFARSTGGELYENFNDLSAAMGQMLTRTSVTYVLAFQPASLEWDGSYHRLRVEVKNQPRGTRVVHRPGYYAPVPYAETTPLERLLDASTQVVAGEDGGSLEVAVLAAPFAMPTEKAYVPVVVEVGGRSLLAGSKADVLPAEIFVYAFDAAGGVQDYITQTLGLDMGKVKPVLEQSGFKFFGHLELPPGDYSLRVLVRNGASGESGMRVSPLRVPSFASETALLPPFFADDPPNRWLLAREQPRGDYQKADYPFMQGGTPYVPSSLPILASEREAPMALVGYNLGAGNLRAAGKVTDAEGREVGQAAVAILRQEAAGAGKPARLAASVTPPRLSPGHYRLEVELTGAAGTHKSSTPFVVRGR